MDIVMIVLVLIVTGFLLVVASSGRGLDFQKTKKKAEQGNAKAQCDLGLMYFDGKGVPQNFFLAYAWFNLSAKQGYREAIELKNSAAGKLSSERLIEAEALSLVLLKGQP